MLFDERYSTVELSSSEPVDEQTAYVYREFADSIGTNDFPSQIMSLHF